MFIIDIDKNREIDIHTYIYIHTYICVISGTHIVITPWYILFHSTVLSASMVILHFLSQQAECADFPGAIYPRFVEFCLFRSNNAVCYRSNNTVCYRSNCWYRERVPGFSRSLVPCLSVYACTRGMYFGVYVCIWGMWLGGCICREAEK